MFPVRVSSEWKWAGIVLTLAVGAIHLMATQGDDARAVAYLGVLFLVNAIGAAVAAVGIWLDDSWGWALAILVAAGAFAGYVVSRTIGLSGFYGSWADPLGILSLVVEAALTILGVWVLVTRSTLSPLER